MSSMMQASRLEEASIESQFRDVCSPLTGCLFMEWGPWLHRGGRHVSERAHASRWHNPGISMQTGDEAHGAAILTERRGRQARSCGAYSCN